MKRLLLPLLLTAAALRAPAAEVGFNHWRMQPSGSLAVGANGVQGSRIDLEDDLGYGGTEPVTDFNLVLGEEHQLAIDWLSIDASASATTTHAIRFSDLVFPQDLPIHSSFDGELLRAAYRYVAGSDEVRGGFLAGMQFINVDTEASAAGIGATSERMKSALPVVGGVVEVTPAPYLSAHASIAGGSWTWADVGATFLDLDAGVRLQLQGFFAGVGYRYMRLNGEDDSVPLEADITLSGPTFMAGVTF